MKPVAPVLLDEWSGWTHVPGAHIEEADERLIEALESGDEQARLQVRIRKQGLFVRARSWVGAARIGGVDVIVRPKLAGLEDNFLRLLHRAGGADAIRRISAQRAIDVGRRGGLFDVLALVLCEEVASLLRNGLLLGYRVVEEDLPVIRGRLLADRQVLQRFGRLERLECRYEELDANVPDNFLLLEALRAAGSWARGASVRRAARRWQAELLDHLDVDVSPPGVDWLRSVVPPDREFDAANRHYEAASKVAWVVLDHYQVQRPLSPFGALSSFAFFIDMNPLFERFLTSWLTAELQKAGLTVKAQRSRLALRDVKTGRGAGRIRPDILVSTRSSAPLAVDAKYKRYSRNNRPPSPASGDLAQALLYAEVYGGRAPDRSTTLLVYPVEEHEHPRRRVLELAGVSSGGRTPTVELLPFPLSVALEDRADPRLDELAGRLRELAIGSAPSEAAAAGHAA